MIGNKGVPSQKIISSSNPAGPSYQIGDKMRFI